MPCNAGTGRRYSGVNVLMLWVDGDEAWLCSSQRWLTYRQAQAAGGNVRKGEGRDHRSVTGTGSPRRDRGEGDGQRRGSAAGCVPEAIYRVQCRAVRGLGARTFAALGALPEDQIAPVADDLIAASGVDFRVAGVEAFYLPAEDLVVVPPRRAYFDEINAYRTWLHELVHATGLCIVAWAGPDQSVRVGGLCAGGAYCRDGIGVPVRVARDRADRPACRLYRLMA